MSGKIRPGDKILAVNRENVSSSTQSHVIQLLQVIFIPVCIEGGRKREIEGERKREEGRER